MKFNPWHDPDDGRFTFAGQGEFHPRGGGAGADKRRRASGDGTGGGGGGGWGRSDAPRKQGRQKSTRWTGGGFTGGGGGDFRGAGAHGSGDWKTREEVAQRAAQVAQRRAAREQARVRSGAVVVTARPVSTERQHTTIKNGYRYDYDRSARVQAVDAALVLAPGWRSRKNQARASATDRRSNDHGGHYIAVRFNGSHSKLNRFAQDANFNMGAYRALEDKWAAALRNGKKVHVRIVPFYHGASKRPFRLHVDWYVNGRHRAQDFENEKGGKTDGR